MLLETRNPFDNSIVDSRPYSTPAEIDHALNQASIAQAAWRRVPLVERRDRVLAALAWFRANADSVARDVTLQMGKPLAEATSECSTMLGRAETMAALAEESLASETLCGSDGIEKTIHHAPLGTVLAIAAWNYPLLITINVVVPALIAGNAVVIKHSERTPLCGDHFLNALHNVGPEGLVSALMVTHEGVASLVADERIDHVAFTGSVAGGRAVQRAAGERFIAVGLELGGNDPAYVAEDVDVEYAAANIVEGACYNAGQSCCSVERVYVHRSSHQAFVDATRRHLEAITCGDPLDANTTLGPLANPAHLAFLQSHVDDAIARGAHVVCGGSTYDGRFYRPTLLDDCPNDARVMQEESFGPLVPILMVENDEEALAHFNDTSFGLTASIWTNDRARAEWFAQRHDTGTFFQNRCDFADPLLPWTGCRDTGRGVSLSRYGYHALTRLTSTHFRPTPA